MSSGQSKGGHRVRAEWHFGSEGSSVNLVRVREPQCLCISRHLSYGEEGGLQVMGKGHHLELQRALEHSW